MSDRFDAARAVADAVLYEGYVLYPYRASAPKNQMRWQFGVLAPAGSRRPTARSGGANRTECVVDPGESPRLTVRVRCLQVQHRSIEVPTATASGGRRAGRRRRHVVPWDEAVEREVDLPAVPAAPAGGARTWSSWRCPRRRARAS